MAINASLVKELREKTGAGILQCKKALEEKNGDIEEAIKLLRKQGLKAAEKKSSRVTSEGQVGHYIHFGGKIGVLVEVNCETDFVARTDEFQQLIREIAMHIAALNPKYLSREDVPEKVLNEEKEVYKDQMKDSGKPENILDKIIIGKVEKFYQSVCLLEQAFVKEESLTIQELLKRFIAKMGENTQIRRFIRYEVGEGL